MAPSRPMIKVEALSFRYPGRKRLALQKISFEVQAGEMLLVLGPSGCGKSTLTFCLNGLIPHSIAGDLGGRVLIGGQEIGRTPVAETARQVGVVFQDPDTQFCMLRVDDEIAFGLENLRVPSEEMPERIRRALRLVGLQGVERLRIDRLSGGNRQRLALACVLALEASVLVFDEPTSNLDPAGAEQVFADIARLKAAGDRTLVVIEHRLDSLIGLVDRVLVLGPDGQPITFGRPADVFRHHADELESLGIWVPQVSELAHRLAARGISLNPYPLTVNQADVAISAHLDGGVSNSNRLGLTVRQVASSHAAGDRDALIPGFTPNPVVLTSPAPSFARANGKPRPEQITRAPLAIEINGLSYRYPSGQPALSNVKLEIPEGSYLAIVGPNGAGKSTLARHLIGSLRPPRGTVRLFGRDQCDLPSRELTRLIGYVFQNPEHQFVASTVQDELAFGLRVRGVPEAETRTQVQAMLEEFGLGALGQASPFALSHGEKRRLSVAAMLILGQRILVLDEPTFGQDQKNTVALMARLQALNRAGRTIVLITHDMRLVLEHAEQVAVMIEGTPAYTGPPDRLFAHPQVLSRGHLIAPPMVALSSRLARRDPSFPIVGSVAGLMEELEQRLPLGEAS